VKPKIENAFERVARVSKEGGAKRALPPEGTQTDVEQLLSEGRTLHEVAEIMGVHYSTVYRYLKAAMEAAGCRTHIQYLCLLSRRGTVT
jgi:DNA-binding NarL/FixJ family response regulator